ncbi:MAG TPA: molybdenum cofactor biosynthesis protein MoaE [Candidatus Polarisedimenticolia bacterium]|nr:molybdenum cofactor biosynthesis protein MoaE [Candidatus Polarisedimenticolia bacterium]
MSGGARPSGPYSHLGPEPIDPRVLEARVSGPDRGAVALFAGVVRDHHEGRCVRRLEYSAYEDMAGRVLAAIVDEAARRFGTPAIAVQHRLGPLAVGETSVVVAAAAVHRREALAACAWVIDEVKARAPIWKKEFGDDGVFWIEGPGSCPSAVPAEPGSAS